MAQTEEEKQAATEARAQKAAEERIAELEKRLDAAAKKEAAAEARVADLQGQLESTRLSAPNPVPASGTVTIDATSTVVS